MSFSALSVYPRVAVSRSASEAEINSVWSFSLLCKSSRTFAKFVYVSLTSHCSISILSSNIPSAPAHGVNVSQKVRYATACYKYHDFVDRGKLLAVVIRLSYSEDCVNS